MPVAARTSLRERAQGAAKQRLDEAERQAEAAEYAARKVRLELCNVARANLSGWLQREFGVTLIVGVEFSDGERWQDDDSDAKLPTATARYVDEGLEFFATDHEPDTVQVRVLGHGGLHIAHTAADVGDLLETVSE